MSKFTDELYSLMEQAYLEENPSVQLSFNNRVYKKYGKQFNKKYDYISGKNTALIAEQLKNTSISEFEMPNAKTNNNNVPNIPLLNTLEEYDEFKTDAPQAEMMYVPEELRKEWVQADTKKFFIQDEFKRELLEEYLMSLPSDKRLKAIKVMCENSNSKNYYRFLDLSTSAYTPNQEILSNDLINFFHNKYLNEYIEQQNTLKRIAPENVNAQSINQARPKLTPVKNPEIYQRVMTDHNYFNPYDERDMITPKIKTNPENEFLTSGSQQQNQMFQMMDRNSAMYMRQKNQFNNAHNDIARIRREQLRNAQFNAEMTSLNQYQKPMTQASLANNNLQPLSQNPMPYYQPAQRQAALMVSYGSLVTEIPKVDNIADFINSRNMLAQQNTLRKQYNIATSIDYNNELVGAEDSYDIYNPNYYAPYNDSFDNSMYQPSLDLSEEIVPAVNEAQVVNPMPQIYLQENKFEPAQQEGALHESGLDKNTENEGVIKTAIKNNEMVNDTTNNLEQNLNNHEQVTGEEQLIETPEELKEAMKPVTNESTVATPTPSVNTPEEQAANDADAHKTIKMHNQVEKVTPLSQIIKNSKNQFSPQELDNNDNASRFEKIRISSQNQIADVSSSRKTLNDRYDDINAIGSEFISNRKEENENASTPVSVKIQAYRLDDFNRIENFFKENRPLLVTKKKTSVKDDDNEDAITPKKRKSKGRLNNVNNKNKEFVVENETPTHASDSHSIIPTKQRMEKYDVNENEEEIIIKKRVLA